jgi:hypothetical protein
MIAAVLAIVVLNVFDVHGTGIKANETAIELVHLDGETSTSYVSTEDDENHYCESPTGCHVGLEATFKQLVSTGPGATTFPTPFDLVDSSSKTGFFRPPIRT